MGMYYKQQQRNTRLHTQLTHQLDKHLNSNEPHSPKAESLAATKPVVSLRWTFFVVLTMGGIVAILLALLERQDTSIITSSIQARTLAILGVASIIFGCGAMLVGRHPMGRTR